MTMGNRTCSPLADLPAGLPQIPPAQLAYQTGFFSNGDKFNRSEQSASWMLPSQQSLKAGNFSGSEGNNRLIEIAKFSPFERATQIRLQLQSSHHTGSHICVEHLIAGLAQRLGPVHCRVGISQDIFRLLVSWIAQRNSDAHRGEHLFPTQNEWRRQSLHHAVRGALGIARIFNVVEQNSKFVSP